MRGSLVADLGVGPEIWLFLTLLSLLTLFFKFSRFWSIRNLDLFLLFALAPGLMLLVGTAGSQPWSAFVWLFLGSLCWLTRCLLDVGMPRRPLLEPNLNAAGLACLSIGVLGLFVVETVSLSVGQGSARNPADTHPGRAEADARPGAFAPDATVSRAVSLAPISTALKADPHQALARVVAVLAQLSLVGGLVAVGWRHFERPIAGLSVAACYLLLPYSRFALVDGGQLVSAALIVVAILLYRNPWAAGGLIGLASAWMPASIGLVPLWAGFYRGRGTAKFAAIAAAVLLGGIGLAIFVPGMNEWAIILGARTLREAGLWPTVDAPITGSFWSGIDASYRLPVWIAYIALVIVTTFWPAEKTLGELISSSAAILIASQFWYLAAGGTLVLLYLPLVILMMFRPTLSPRRPLPSRPRRERKARTVGADV